VNIDRYDVLRGVDIIRNIIKEELVTIDKNDFKRVTYDNGEKIYKGYDKQFNAWVTLRFRQTDDTKIVNEIENVAQFLM
jgi:hypothetical protein